jgi:predicted alpha/beta hydrolase family esterase
VSFPAEADDFRSIVAATLPFPALLVTSTTDPYCSTDMADALADAWGARHVSLGDLGHLNANSGVGDWPAGRQLLREFVTEVAGA